MKWNLIYVRCFKQCQAYTNHSTNIWRDNNNNNDIVIMIIIIISTNVKSLLASARTPWPSISRGETDLSSTYFPFIFFLLTTHTQALDLAIIICNWAGGGGKPFFIISGLLACIPSGPELLRPKRPVFELQKSFFSSFLFWQSLLSLKLHFLAWEGKVPECIKNTSNLITLYAHTPQLNYWNIIWFKKCVEWQQIFMKLFSAAGPAFGSPPSCVISSQALLSWAPASDLHLAPWSWRWIPFIESLLLLFSDWNTLLFLVQSPKSSSPFPWSICNTSSDHSAMVPPLARHHQNKNEIKGKELAFEKLMKDPFTLKKTYRCRQQCGNY